MNAFAIHPRRAASSVHDAMTPDQPRRRSGPLVERHICGGSGVDPERTGPENCLNGLGQ